MARNETTVGFEVYALPVETVAKVKLKRKRAKKKNPWAKLLRNVGLSAAYGSFGGSSKNPKNRPDKQARGSQSTKRHKIFITAEDLERKFNEQGKKCFWLGMPINPDWIFESYFAFAPSVDRLDNAKEYEYDNIVICTRFANLGRGNTSPGKFAFMMKNLAKFGLKPNLAKLEELITYSINVPVQKSSDNCTFVR